MATHYPAPDPIQSTFLIPGSNTPGNGVLVFTYTNLTSTKTTVYKDSAGATPHTNPIVLDSGGNLPSGSQVYIPAGVTLTVKYAPSNDTDPPTSVYRTLNDITGVNDVSSISAEWISGPTPTFVSATSFTLVGDQTSTFHVGRRLKTTNTGGTIYSRISNSVYTSLTTVTVVNDSSTLDSGLSEVSYGLLSSVNASIPAERDNLFRILDNTDPSKVLAFEASGITTSTQVTLTAQNTSGSLALVSEFAYSNSSGAGIGRLTYPPSTIQGMVPAISSSNSITVSTGVTVNSSASQNLILSAPMEKSLTSTWVVSTGNGGLLDSGSISTNIWYFGHAFKSTTNGWVDVGWSSSYSAPTLPTGYTIKSHSPVAASRVVSGSSNSFTAYELAGGGIEYLWATPPLDVNALQSTTANLRTLTGVPTSISVKAYLNVFATNVSNVDCGVYVSCPDVTDQAVSITASPLLNMYVATDSAADSVGGYVTVRTNSSAQIRTRALEDSTTTRIATVGFEWSRR